MIRKSQPKADPIECAMELAVDPGKFITDYAGFSFVRGLGEVAAQIATIEPSRWLP